MDEKDNQNELKIFEISIWRLFSYFIIYSFIGYIIETLFGIATKGVWESRQSFLYGPFLRNIWNRSYIYNSILKIF